MYYIQQSIKKKKKKKSQAHFLLPETLVYTNSVVRGDAANLLIGSLQKETRALPVGLAHVYYEEALPLEKVSQVSLFLLALRRSSTTNQYNSRWIKFFPAMDIHIYRQSVELTPLN